MAYRCRIEAAPCHVERSLLIIHFGSAWRTYEQLATLVGKRYAAARLQPGYSQNRRRRRVSPKSPAKQHFADVAQLVEHFTRNEGVPGSNPGVGFNRNSLQNMGI